MRIFVLGYPGSVGGAQTECWATVKLWRQAGWDVHLVPTWGRDDTFEKRLDEIGCTTHHVGPADLESVPGLAGLVVVGFCNHHFTTAIPRLRKLDCRLVWASCMTFVFRDEHRTYPQHGLPDAFMFQSQFQQKQLEPTLAQYGYRPEQGHLIHGAFDVTEFPFAPRPHPPGSEFVVGRLARADRDKWSSNTWSIYGSIPYAHRKALLMGVNQHIEGKLGPAPPWATCMPAGAIPVPQFLKQCHALLPVNGGARENWPRIGLEAMAAGVPIVTHNRWGWPEMIVHDETGFLCDNNEELAYYTAQLAYDQRKRLDMVQAARARVERLAHPETVLAGWRRLLASVEHLEIAAR